MHVFTASVSQFFKNGYRRTNNITPSIWKPRKRKSVPKDAFFSLISVPTMASAIITATIAATVFIRRNVPAARWAYARFIRPDGNDLPTARTTPHAAATRLSASIPRLSAPRSVARSVTVLTNVYRRKQIAEKIAKTTGILTRVIIMTTHTLDSFLWYLRQQPYIPLYAPRSIFGHTKSGELKFRRSFLS